MEENGIEDMVVDEDIVFLIHYGEHTIRLELPAQEKVGEFSNGEGIFLLLHQKAKTFFL
jgi:hypothetical protein